MPPDALSLSQSELPEEIEKAIEAFEAEAFWDGKTGPNSAVAQAREALTAAILSRLGEAEKWRPIETAPKDGSSFLAVHEKSGVRQITWYGKTSHVPLYGWAHGEDVEEIDLWQPTHWMPLPAPPALSEATPQGEQ